MLRPLLAIALLCACVARADDTPPLGPLPEGVTPARYRRLYTTSSVRAVVSPKRPSAN